MKQKRKVLSVLLMFTLILPIMFGGKKEVTAKELTPKEILTQMEKSTKDLKNADISVKMNVTMSAQGQSIDMKMTGDVVAFSDPLKMKMDMKMDLGSLGSQKMQMYYGTEGKKAYTYISDGNTWMKQQISKKELEDTIGSYDAGETSAAYIQSLMNFKKVSDSEKVNGKDTVVLKGKISGKEIEKLVESTNLLNGLSSGEADETTFKNVKGFTIKIYVDKKTMQPVKMVMDLKDYMQSIVKNIDSSMKIPKCTMTMVYNEINNVKDFTIPKAALNAQEIK